MSEPISLDGARAQLRLLLANTTNERLANFTVDKLAAMNRTPRREIAQALYEAQMARRVVPR